MTTTPPPPPAWYPDPAAPSLLRYWDGGNWTGQTQPTQQHGGSAANTMPAGFAKLSSWLVVLLVLQGVVTLVTAGVDGWAALLLSGYSKDTASISVPLLGFLDDAIAVLAVLDLATLAPAGVVWVVWQYRLAERVPAYARRRSPAMHVASWIIPVVLWWFPYQNLVALRRHLPADPRGKVASWVWPCWWATWIAGSSLGMIGTRVAAQADSLDDPLLGLTTLAQAQAVSAVADLLLLSAAVLAVVIVRSLTRQFIAFAGGGALQQPAH